MAVMWLGSKLVGFGQLSHFVLGPVTAAAPASEVEAIVRSPTNMAAAKIAAVEYNKIMSLDQPACLRPCLLGKIC